MRNELGRSGSYIREITSGGYMPSVKELFNIMDYFGIGPVEFFAPLANDQSYLAKLYEGLRQLDETELQKADTFILWITGGAYQ